MSEEDDFEKLRALSGPTDMDRYRAAYDAVEARTQWKPTRTEEPYGLDTPFGAIQWKGTTACIDYHCRCGARGHVDVEFAYNAKCVKCGRVYRVAQYVELVELTPEEVPVLADGCVVDFGEDEDQ